MQVFEKAKELTTLISTYKAQGKKTAFVATMGAIHQGHLEMIKDAKARFDIVVCSIFVNPVQFNRSEDYNNYPNRLEEDKNLLIEHNTDILFNPTVEEVYPDKPFLDYQLGNLADTLEGEYRPGHFVGVVAVLKRFFEIIQPNTAYFGEKDYQQVAVVNWLVKHFELNVEIISFPTVRNEEGLALSSRNYNLSDEGEKVAARIFKSLSYCKSNWLELSYNELIMNAKSILGEQFQIDYFEVIDEDSFEKAVEKENVKKPRAFIAAYLEGVRLIDNMALIN